MEKWPIICGEGIEDGTRVFWCIKTNSLQMFVMPLDTSVDVLEDMLTDYAGVDSKEQLELQVVNHNSKRFEDIYFYFKGEKINA